jgi:hypothetical protein
MGRGSVHVTVTGKLAFCLVLEVRGKNWISCKEDRRGTTYQRVTELGIKIFLYEILALRNDWREPCLLLVGAGPGTTS